MEIKGSYKRTGLQLIHELKEKKNSNNNRKHLLRAPKENWEIKHHQMVEKCCSETGVSDVSFCGKVVEYLNIGDIAYMNSESLF